VVSKGCAFFAVALRILPPNTPRELLQATRRALSNARLAFETHQAHAQLRTSGELCADFYAPRVRFQEAKKRT
jgi:hypothetical protein